MRTPAVSTVPLSRGMAEMNSPLKILPRPCSRWYRAPANDVMMSEPSPCRLCFFSELKVTASPSEQ